MMPWSLVRLFVADRKRRLARGSLLERRALGGPPFDPVRAAFERESG